MIKRITKNAAVKISIPLPKAIHGVAKMEALRTGQLLTDLLALVLVGKADPPRTRLYRAGNGNNELVRPSVFLSAATIANAQKQADLEDVSLTVFLSRRIVQHFTYSK